LLETGAAYAMRVDGLRETGSRFFGRVLPVAVDAVRTLEIDDPGDLERARLLAPLLDVAAAHPRLADLDALVLDFDGTLTDDRVNVDQDGRESVMVHRGDGLGIAALRRAGLDVLILSTERNPVVAARARKLGVPALTGIADKGSVLAQWCADNGHALARTGYVGNDLNDLPCFAIVGWPIAVADAHHAVRARARVVTAAPGGYGAVREVASRLLGRDIRDGSEPLALHR
jgi:YrbI family 3-deoxy-D-manno-octulosonate 8-phosphate phosphatase